MKIENLKNHIDKKKYINYNIIINNNKVTKLLQMKYQTFFKLELDPKRYFVISKFYRYST